MTKNQIHVQLKKLRGLERERVSIVDRLIAEEPFARGSLSRVLQRCGKPTCHCVEKPLHPVWRLASSRDGKQRCQLVRKDDVDWITEWVGRYKDFRRDLRALEAIQKEEKALLRGLMEIRSVEYE